MEPGGELCVRLHDFLLKQMLKHADFPIVEQVADRELIAEVLGVRFAKLTVEVLEEELDGLKLKFNLTWILDS